MPSLSPFIIGRKNMLDYAGINFAEVWRAAMGWENPDKSGRKFDDAAERRFWDELAPRYTKEYNLNNDTPLLREKILAKIDRGASVLEIGPGSGNFTLPMAGKAGQILALDFSAAMLKELAERLRRENCANVALQQGKWEDFAAGVRYDYIVSANSLSRIDDMDAAIRKMYKYCKRGIILIRTIQRPFLYCAYKSVGLQSQQCPDYQLLPILFWRGGLQADVEFVNYSKTNTYADEAQLLAIMREELGAEEYLRHKNELLEILRRDIVRCAAGIKISQPRCSVIITAYKNGLL